MGTNFYWKNLPKELKQYEKLVQTQTKDKDMYLYQELMNPLWHIGKRSGAGKYCMDCGTTFCINGTTRIHYNDNPHELFSNAYKEAQKYSWYDKCPICGKEGVYICTFTWTFMKQKQIIQEYELKNINEKLIINEYDEEFTVKEFLHEIETPVEYQSCCAFC